MTFYRQLGLPVQRLWRMEAADVQNTKGRAGFGAKAVDESGKFARV